MSNDKYAYRDKGKGDKQPVPFLWQILHVSLKGERRKLLCVI